MTIFLCILEMRRFRCPASAFYHGGVSWLVPNLTVGSIDEEVGTMVLAARLSKLIYPGWKPLLVFIVHFLLLGCGLALRNTFCLLSFSNPACCVQIFVNFRLWMVAESPFSKETVGAPDSA